MSSVIVPLGGGIDSTAVLAEALMQGNDVRTISFFYGSTHNIYEIEAAKGIAKHYSVDWELLDISCVFDSFKSRLLIGSEDPVPSYEQDPKMKTTVVPSRNIIFMAVLSGLAWSRECEEVWWGMNAGDSSPDCNAYFFRLMKSAIGIGTRGRIVCRGPFIEKEKWEVITRGVHLKAPFHLTRSCYRPQQDPCGKCGACVKRASAFQQCNMEDPASG